MPANNTDRRLCELLQIYQCVTINEQFSRIIVSEYTGLEPHICEGRWYAEIKRCKKFGEAFDWKTMLNVIIRTYLQVKHCKTAVLQLIDDLLVKIQFSQLLKPEIIQPINKQCIQKHYSIISNLAGIEISNLTLEFHKNYQNISCYSSQTLSFSSPAEQLAISTYKNDLCVFQFSQSTFINELIYDENLL
ncbi:Conserved_hypothetical protein [Hexamita inflata]|uniref:Uncharacterized protein n=1 Tax=Hexamita inflata TaxID=28002 RepID=A0AA86RH67_9EUKA|nr:Conserved hypothetical protein [Hexamita inflata]